ncbi:hypothetical protein HCH15_05115 [Corynebacterium testudinoris]|uniref:hypothetical protein n=1 Tax=Corynebacterium testudinoris TaxID=136857 RepID=UPI001C8C2032|nr:hypothetical protein [Corynebacterium testudinoris]MBX8995559.1 hypothetical protein [Corynebacterium testudinoris]
MRLPKTGLYLITVILVAWIGFLAFAIASAPAKAESQFSTSGALEKAVANADAEGLSVVGLSPADLYGEEYVVAAVVCPYSTEDGLMQMYGVDASELNLGPNGVAEDTNYLMLGTREGEVVFDQMSRNEVDLCAIRTQPSFAAESLLPLMTSQEGVWTLLG